jgi:photosystem II stability/assembly factor-like uncharacterized protein
MRTHTICLALAIVLICPCVSAQWVQTNMPYGGSVGCLAVSGTNLFAGTYDDGIYLSTDNGTSWTATNAGYPPFSGAPVTCFAVLGKNLFAGSRGGGPYLSIDSGSSWTPVNTGLTNTDVHSLAAAGTNLFAGTSGGVFLSTDSGSSWTTVSTGLPNPEALGVVALAVSGTNLFAGTYGDGIYLSTNDGTSWTLTPGHGPVALLCLVVIGPYVFAACTSGVFLSTDNGTSWMARNNGLPRSGWMGVPVGSLAVSGTNVFAGTGHGVFLSTDNGTNWTAVNTGLTDAAIISLVAAGTNLFAGTYSSGVWRRSLSEMITFVPQLSSELPATFELGQNYPNPFNPSTTIEYALLARAHVTLTVYNLLGQAVAMLVDEVQEAGHSSVAFNAEGLPSGVYLYELKAGDLVETKRMLLLR